MRPSRGWGDRRGGASRESKDGTRRRAVSKLIAGAILVIAVIFVLHTIEPVAFAALFNADASGGPWLLYAANGDLWESDGGRTVRLTHNGHLSQPSLGPSGIVYVERQRNYSDLWLAGNNRPPVRLTHDASPIIAHNHWVAQPVFVPGENRLEVISDQNKASTGPGDLAIWALVPGQATMTQITHPPSYTGGDQDVAIDPRATNEIVFTRYLYAPDGQLIEELAWLDLKTGRVIPLTAPDQPSRQASFAPDGQQLAFVQTHGQSQVLGIGHLDISAGKPRLTGIQQIASGMVAQPAWSPDGSSLAYLSLVNRRFELLTVAVSRGKDGSLSFGQPRAVTSNASLDATSRPVWLTTDQATQIRAWLQSAGH